MKTELKLSQKQIMSHKMIQSVNILQMSSLELIHFMKETLIENPIVDLETLFREMKQPDEDRKKVKQAENVWDFSEKNSGQNYITNDLKDDYLENIGGAVYETLTDNLNLQLINGPYTKKEFNIFNYIAESLDSRGYFVMPVSDMAEHFKISEEEAYRYLQIMKELEPVGICAQSLQECLLKQLEVNGKKNSIEARIIKDYLELLGRNQLEVIARSLKVPLDNVREAYKKIRSLNPKPAQGFDNGDLYHYVIPDIIVTRNQNQLSVMVNQYSCPSIKVNKDYLNIMNSVCDEETENYLKQKKMQLEEMRGYIAKRKMTMLHLAECVVNVQSDFFIYGKNAIKPFSHKEAAEYVGVHESTISRTIKEKYLQCEWGVFPLHYFFPKKVEATGLDIAAVKVKQKLRKIIEEENKKAPYSDLQLMEMLKVCGVSLSRRTVAKYREEMEIPNCRYRKEF